MEQNKQLALPKGFTITAHTGCLGTVANSLDSIKKGAEAGVDIVEFDLRFLSDGTPILTHSAAEKDNATLFADAVDEVMKYPSLKMNIDLKETAFLMNVQKILKEKNALSRAFFTGVFLHMLVEVKQADTGIPFYLNYTVNPFAACFSKTIKRYIALSQMFGAIGINVSWRFVTKKLVNAVRDEGLLLSVWTVDKPRVVTKMLKYQPNNLTTRQPFMLNDTIKNNGYLRN